MVLNVFEVQSVIQAVQVWRKRAAELSVARRAPRILGTEHGDGPVWQKRAVELLVLRHAPRIQETAQATVWQKRVGQLVVRHAAEVYRRILQIRVTWKTGCFRKTGCFDG